MILNLFPLEKGGGFVLGMSVLSYITTTLPLYTSLSVSMVSRSFPYSQAFWLVNNIQMIVMAVLIGWNDVLISLNHIIDQNTLLTSLDFLIGQNALLSITRRSNWVEMRCERRQLSKRKLVISAGSINRTLTHIASFSPYLLLFLHYNTIDGVSDANYYSLGGKSVFYCLSILWGC